MKMEDTYQKIMLSQEDGKKLEVKSGQTLVQTSSTTDHTNTLENSGNTLILKEKNKSVVVPVKGLSFKIGDIK